MANAPDSANSQYLIDHLIPAHSVNLIGGRSGSGKTTLLLQILEDWTASREVFGYSSHPAPFCIVACAKPAAAIHQTASRISCQLPSPLPVCSIARDRLATGESPSPEAAIAAARIITPDLSLLILDGIGVLCQGRITEYNVVAEFMSRLSRLAIRERITIIGLGPMAKSGNETPRASRELFLGSVAWGEHAETIILIDKDEASEPQSSTRTVTVLPTNAPPQSLRYDFDKSGRLFSLTDESIQETMLDARLASLPAGELFSGDNLLSWAKEFGCSRATAYRWIKLAIESGRVERIHKGLYRITELASKIGIGIAV